MARTKQISRRPTDRVQLASLSRSTPLPTPALTEDWNTETTSLEDSTIKVEDAADDMSTPVPIANNSTPTPRPFNRSAFPRRTFKTQREKDRKAAENVIAKEIAKLQRADMWPRMTVEERRAAIVERYESTMEMRSKHPMWWSAKSHYPEEHDERAENEWVVEAFGGYLEPELDKAKAKGKGKGKGGRAARDVGSYHEDSSDDEEAEGPAEDDAVVKKEWSGMGREYNKSMLTELESKAQSKDKQIKELKIEIEALERKKRHISAPELPKAKKSKTERGMESSKVEEEVTTSEDDDPVPEGKRVYTAVPRGMAISNISRARHDRAVGWPWSGAAKAAKARIVIVGQDGAKES